MVSYLLLFCVSAGFPYMLNSYYYDDQETQFSRSRVSSETYRNGGK